jgi:6-phosphogluconate dehydrogenase
VISREKKNALRLRNSAATGARTFKGNRDRFVDAVRDALYASKIISYAQGMELLRSGSTTYEWNLNLSDIATIWRGRLYHPRQVSQSNR